MNQGNSHPSAYVAPAEHSLIALNATQLSKLSSILNGLEGGAQIIQRHLQEAETAIAAGTYRVDSIKLSQRIVREALRPL